MVTHHCPEKEEQHQTRITCEDVLVYFDNVTIHTTSIVIIKMHWNAVVSTPGDNY
tara:strand:+ start:294 stop:458 length:165 start_codon:yes stop_codon:yes gene_type:complete